MPKRKRRNRLPLRKKKQKRRLRTLPPRQNRKQMSCLRTVKKASTAEFTRRRTVLAAKQNAIRDVIAAAQKELHDLPDDEYFSVLLKLAQKNALPGDAEMQLNEKDLARMPQDFSAQLKAAVPGTNITVSNTPCNIPDGFLLVYGGIDVNCTFASLFEAAGDTLQDLAGGMLFR